MNSRYNALVASNARLQEKINRKVGHFAELRAEVFDLSEKHEKQKFDEAIIALLSFTTFLSCQDIRVSQSALSEVASNPTGPRRLFVLCAASLTASLFLLVKHLAGLPL
ncbi:hypothetical protein Tco_0778855 [Tanacetum coccineum]